MEPLEQSCNATTSPAAEVLKPAEAPADGEECPICMGLETAAASEWKETACGHKFHDRCVERWLEMKGSCPTCRCQLLIVVPPAAVEQAYSLPNFFRMAIAETRARFPDVFS